MLHDGSRSYSSHLYYFGNVVSVIAFLCGRYAQSVDIKAEPTVAGSTGDTPVGGNVGASLPAGMWRVATQIYVLMVTHVVYGCD